MGTNFYAVYKRDGLKLELFHLGKRSMGCKFTWHGFIDNATIATHKSFLETFDKIDDFCVEDEYGKEYGFEEFVALAEAWDENIEVKDNTGGNIIYREFC